jgi:hypothetical protein
MNTVFYRYIRPTRLNPQRFEIETLPRGGVCLRFQERGDGSLWFTHARCHEDELFSKNVARLIADSRAVTVTANARDGIHLVNEFLGPIQQGPTEALVEQVVEHCLSWVPPLNASIATKNYLVAELREVGHALLQICSVNTKERMKQAEWMAAANAAKDMYKGLEAK